MNEKKYKRIFTVVIDSLGAGEMLDAVSYGDAVSYTHLTLPTIRLV